MPYIKPNRRKKFEYALDLLSDEIDPLSAGELNFVISMIVNDWANNHEVLSYAVLNEAHGTFLSAAAEFYRRRVVEYEEQAIATNGDIY